MKLKMEYKDYEKRVVQNLWIWATQHHMNELDGKERNGGPPVLKCGSSGIIVPSDDRKKDFILGQIPKPKRHRYFNSLKSSQALCQSVFGGISAFNRLDILQGIPAECGQPAFFENHMDFKPEFEYEVDFLEESQPTSVDVMFWGSQKRVAVECKFTEKEFGSCSRTKLKKTNPKYCNGNYQFQNNRQNRCSLSEQKIRYWEFLPGLFDWNACLDHSPCPFKDTYQLARNALAATVSKKRELDPLQGHVLVIYDNRNPEFRTGGKAQNQWQCVNQNCKVPSLFRRISWQHLMAVLAKAPELNYLVKGLEQKYGFKALSDQV
ncbi:MAG: hypothetical protein OXH90_05590 [Paracoccaceae bacterium]|nr:hypothetical protein [Paracoccaceae bacterium]MDE2916715.1 hypothetical protein [Paracoccaceae bacterium]